MFSHLHVGISDFERALAFYRPLMQCLGQEERFCDADRPWAAWHCAGGQRPLFIIGRPFDGQEASGGNGAMVAFMASSRAIVRQAYEIALVKGGLSEGAPGLREHYHSNYYGAYFRDPDGNKLCVVCHEAE